MSAITARERVLLLAAAVFLALLATTGAVGFALAGAAAVVGPVAGWHRLAGARAGQPVAVLLTAVVLLGVAHLAAPTPPPTALPAPTQAAVGSATPAPSGPAALPHILPESAAAWVAAGDALAVDTPTAPGIAAYQHALLVEPGNRLAAARLATAFSHMHGNLAVEQAAAYYTRLAGGVAPPQPPEP